MEKKENTDWKDIFKNPVKKHSTENIEETIAKCLSALVGEELKTNIKFIDYDPDKDSISPGSPVEIHLVVSKPIKNLFNK